VIEDLVLVDPWWDLRSGGADEERQRRSLTEELLTELSPDHPLSGVRVQLIGRSTASDDVLLHLEDGRWRSSTSPGEVHRRHRRTPE
jgi:hypothetical protein